MTRRKRANQGRMRPKSILLTVCANMLRLLFCMQSVCVHVHICFSLILSVLAFQRATNFSMPCSKTWAWFPDYLSGCFIVAVISWQYPYVGAGGLGFYLPYIVAIVQCDGLGKVMAMHIQLPKRNLTLDDGGMFPRLLLNCLLFHFVQFTSFFCSCLSLSLSGFVWSLPLASKPPLPILPVAV